jgi:predicted DNA-binding transcriptional regulator
LLFDILKIKWRVAYLLIQSVLKTEAVYKDRVGFLYSPQENNMVLESDIG